MSAQSMISHPDSDAILNLNEQYLADFMSADLDWYRAHLVDDFVCIEADGSVLDRAAFLREIEHGPDVAEYDLEDVHVCIYGTTAIVQATGRFARSDESTGTGHYTDVYVKLDDTWMAVTAQIMRGSGK